MPDLPQVPRRFSTAKFAPSSYRQMGRSQPGLPPSGPGLPPVSPSPYGALAGLLNEAGEDLGAIGRQIESGAAADAADQGANAVGTDVNGNPTVELRSNSSASGRAYNQAAKMGFLAKFQRVHGATMREKATEFEGDPEGYAEWAESYVAEASNLAAEQDPVLHGPATQALELYASQNYEGLVGRKHRADIANAHDDLAGQANVLIEDAKRLAKQGGTATADFAETFGSFSDIVRELGDNPEFAALNKNPAWAAKTLMDAQEQVTDAALDGVVEQVANTRDAESGLKSVETILDEGGFSDAQRAEKRLEWRAKVLDAAAGRLVMQGKDAEAAALITSAPENFIAGTAGVADRIVGVESGGDPAARPRNPVTGKYLSSAAGVGQFIDSTWIEVVSKHRPDLVEGKTRDQILMMRGDPTLGREMVERHAEDNAAALTAAGLQATPGNVYLAHFAGVDKAVEVIKASSTASAEAIFGKAAVEANTFLKGKTAGEVVAWAERKMGGEPEAQLSSRGVEAMSKVQKQIAQRDAQHSGLRREVNDAYTQAKSGFAPAETSMRDLRARVNGSGDAELVARLGAAERTFEFTRQIQATSPASLEAWVRQERTRLDGRGGEEEIDRLQAAEATLKKMRTELASDPLTWAANAGLVEVAPLDFNNPESMHERRSAAAVVAQHYGIPEKLLTRGERDILTARFRDPDPTARLGVAQSIATGFGDDAPRAISEIAKDNPAAAHLTRLLTLGPEYGAAVRDGFKGLDMQSGGKAQTRVADEAIGTAIDGRLGATRKEITQAANAIYAGWAQDRGIAEFDEDLYRDAVQVASGRNTVNGAEKGGVGAYNGRKVLLPSHMDDGDLQAAVEGLSEADLMRLSATGGAPTYRGRNGMALVKPGDLRSAYLVTVGMGVYQVSMTDPTAGSPAYVLDAVTGEPYAINLNGRTP